MSIRLRPATEADLPEIVNISVAAFHPSTDAITRAFFPAHLQPADGPEQAYQREWSAMRNAERLHKKNSLGTVAVDDALDGQVVGYTFWFLPQLEEDAEEPTPPETKTPAGVDMEVGAALKKITEEDVEATFGERGLRDVWYLDSIGVSPKQQRRGIGKKLLEWGVGEADKQGKDCYLHGSPAGVPLYRAVGFEINRTLDVFGTDYISMIRRSARAG